MSRQKLFSKLQYVSGNMCRSVHWVLLFLIVSFPVHARMTPEDLKAIYETGLIPLTDDQEGIYKSGRDYLIFETMRIKRGDTAVFVPGTRLFFHSNAKITVHGTLILKGTPEEPVTIGKLNVTIPKLTPKVKMNFDSTSFYIYRAASLVMHHVKIGDSTVSFRFTDSSSEFSFDSVLCAGNRLSLPDTTLHLWPTCMLTCSKTRGKLSRLCVPPPPIPASAKVVVHRDLTWSGLKIPVRIGLGLGTMVAVGGWLYHNNKAGDAEKDYDESKNGDEIKHLKDINLTGLRNRNFAAFAIGCGTAALSVTFLIGGEDKK